jgi:diguanylate cyclase (GGDEF)-like protein
LLEFIEKARIFDFTLFFTGVAIAFLSEGILMDRAIFIKALCIFWLFSSLYYHLRIMTKNGKTTFDYGISYSLSFALFAGPLGLFIFESLYRFTVYITKKKAKTADPQEFLDTFYNIGAFVVTTSIGYWLFFYFLPIFQVIPFGYWILVFMIVLITSTLSSLCLIIIFFLKRDMNTLKEAFLFIVRSRSILDIGKVALTNGLLYLFLQEQQWDMLICLFILNYLVSHSFISKAQNIQDKAERDKFEQMAYTDFLTGTHNRAYMDQKMAELNQSNEYIGIVVADIDKFKRINDNYNHAVGDKVIQHFAETLRSSITEEDEVFRSGGEEFTIFLRGRDFDYTNELIEQIQSRIERNGVEVDFNSAPMTITYTASFGLYFFEISDRMPMERAYVLADHLLLESKQSGRNRVTVKNGLALEASI